jgi:hypothetical protein
MVHGVLLLRIQGQGEAEELLMRSKEDENWRCSTWNSKSYPCFVQQCFTWNAC